MMKKMICVSLIFMGFSVFLSGAQVPSIRPCPDFHPVPNFNLERYMGRWYEIARYFAIFEFGGKCVTADYALHNGTVSVVNRQISAITGLPASIEGVGKKADAASQDAKLSVIFPSLPVRFEAPYWVLSTDYDSYALVWSCVDLGFFTTRNAWILTRVPSPEQKTVEKIDRLLKRLGIGQNFMKTDQEHCAYSPVDMSNHVK